MELLMWKKKYRNSLLFSQNYKKNTVVEEGIEAYIKDSPIKKFISEHRDILNQNFRI